MENERERDVIAGRNAVTEALKAGRPIDSILVRRGEKNGSVSSILRMAKQAGIPVKEVDSRKLDGMCGDENHQGVIAIAAVHAFSEVEDIFALAESRNEPPFIRMDINAVFLPVAQLFHQLDQLVITAVDIADNIILIFAELQYAEVPFPSFLFHTHQSFLLLFFQSFLS